MEIIEATYVFPQVPYIIGTFLTIISIFVVGFLALNCNNRAIPIVAFVIALLIVAGTYGVTFIHTDEMLYTVEFTDRVPYRKLVNAGYSVEEDIVGGQVLKIKGPIGLEDKVLQ